MYEEIQIVSTKKVWKDTTAKIVNLPVDTWTIQNNDNKHTLVCRKSTKCGNKLIGLVIINKDKSLLPFNYLIIQIVLMDDENNTNTFINYHNYSYGYKKLLDYILKITKEKIKNTEIEHIEKDTKINNNIEIKIEEYI